jgi:hypothetical protein
MEQEVKCNVEQTCEQWSPYSMTIGNTELGWLHVLKRTSTIEILVCVIGAICGNKRVFLISEREGRGKSEKGKTDLLRKTKRIQRRVYKAEAKVRRKIRTKKKKITIKCTPCQGMLWCVLCVG